MRLITLTLSIDADALLDLLTQAVEKGIAPWAQAVAERIEQRSTEEISKPLPEVAVNVAAPQPTIAEKNMPGEKLLDVNSVAGLLGVSTRMVWRLSDGGRMPRPIRLGRLVRWKSDVIDEWITAGCPKSARRK
jgi:predicted DNA-binding transcriptional regulator AlpA